MNIQHIFQELQSASDFELFRLKVAMNKLLDDPDRVNALRKKMTIGMQVDYFCEERNRAIACRLVDIKRSRASVIEIETGQSWTLPFYYLNLDHISTEVTTNSKLGMSKAELYVGSTVGFIDSRDNQECIGQVVKLNPKRAVILIANTKWNVPYQMLFPVINSELDSNKTLLLAK
ncbi:MAG: hypothetical protein GY951_14215 [Psychromonas sp.]|nr:hypothetical protein [Alteromonadales bacterium]MCP5079196.1 hypothetical protein [Psychromonas sp.]